MVGTHIKAIDPAMVQRHDKVQRFLKPLGFVLAIAAAVFTYYKSESPPLCIFVFLIVLLVIAGRIGELIAYPGRIQRAIFGAVLPVVGIVTLYYAYQQWGNMWLAAVLGLVIGIVASIFSGVTLFKRIAVQEAQRKKMGIQELSKPDKAAHEMKARFSASEWDSVKRMPSFMFWAVAVADNTDPKKAIKTFSKSVANADEYKDPLLRAILLEIRGAILDMVSSDKGKPAMGLDFDAMGDFWDILDGELSKDEYKSFLSSLLIFGRKIAEVEGPLTEKKAKILADMAVIGSKAGGMPEEFFLTFFADALSSKRYR